tara:strand:+ start:185 stop:1156 length:972 start_codon:yes stop_codon:yes gene_type:complete
MDIDEFLETEINAEKKEDAEKKPVSTEIPGEAKDNVKNFFELWKKIEDAKFKWDDKLYMELNETRDKLEKELGKTLLTIRRKKKEIKRLIGKSLNEIENKNYEAATKIYAEIRNMKNEFPDFLLEEKKEMNKEIFLLHEKLHNQIDSKFIKDFKESIAKVSTLIEDSFSNLNKMDVEKAKIIYEKALNTYRDLPDGFMQKKLELSAQLLKLYKDLSIQTRIKELKQLLSDEGSITADDRLKQLSRMAKDKRISLSSKLESLGEQHIPDKSLLSSLIARKLERARINLEKELYTEAKRNIESVIKVDPRNAEAKRMLSKIPLKH